jgi:hypothetical protein
MQSVHFRNQTIPVGSEIARNDCFVLLFAWLSGYIATKSGKDFGLR